MPLANLSCAKVLELSLAGSFRNHKVVLSRVGPTCQIVFDLGQANSQVLSHDITLHASMQPPESIIPSTLNGYKEKDSRVLDPTVKLGSASLQLDQFTFPFENVVFEGGSNKLLAYCGAIRALEDVGVWKQIKRLAGSGSGAVAATLLAVGYSSHQLEEYFQEDLRTTFAAGSCLGCKLSSKYGIRPNKKIATWVGNRLREIGENPDITFADIHRKFNKELAIAVTNVQLMCVEFCHLKTTPHLSVRQAIRMSLASPGLCQPVKQRLSGEEHLFVQGGTTCNYPVSCFDGWWLSMNPADAFIKRINNFHELPRLTDRDNRFGRFNSKTIGIVVFDDTSVDNISAYLADRGRNVKITRPSSTLLRGIRSNSAKEAEVRSEEYSQFVSAANKFLQLLEMRNEPETEILNRKDISELLSKGVLTGSELSRLFGQKANADVIWQQFGKEKVTFYDLINHLEGKRRIAQAQCSRDRARHINDVTSYFDALNEILENYSRGWFFKVRDVERTVAISTGHIRRSDGSETLEEADRKFLVKQGTEAMRLFLERFISMRSSAIRRSMDEEEGHETEQRAFSREDLQRFIDDDGSEIIDATDYMEVYVEK